MNVASAQENKITVTACEWRGTTHFNAQQGEQVIGKLNLLFEGSKTQISVGIPLCASKRGLQRLFFACREFKEGQFHPQKPRCFLNLTAKQIQVLSLEMILCVNGRDEKHPLELQKPATFETGQKYCLKITTETFPPRGVFAPENTFSAAQINQVRVYITGILLSNMVPLFDQIYIRLLTGIPHLFTELLVSNPQPGFLCILAVQAELEKMDPHILHDLQKNIYAVRDLSRAHDQLPRAIERSFHLALEVMGDGGIANIARMYCQRAFKDGTVPPTLKPWIENLAGEFVRLCKGFKC